MEITKENQKSKIKNQQSTMVVGIIGSGTMGSGIAQVAATAGCCVKLYDTNQAALDKAKASLEKKGSPEEIKSMDLALAIKIKDNHKEIVEQKRAETLSRVYQENERLRKKDPSRYGSMNPRTPLVNFSTPWKDLYPQEKSEYDRALEDLQGDNLGDKKYY